MGQLCANPKTEKEDWEEKAGVKYNGSHYYGEGAPKKKTQTRGLAGGAPRDQAAVIAPLRAPERVPEREPVPGQRVPERVPEREPVPAPQTRAVPGTQPQGTSSMSAAASASSSAPASQTRGNSRGDDNNVRMTAVASQESVTGILLPDLTGGGKGQDWQAGDFMRLIADARSSHQDALIKRLLKQVAESNYLLRNKWGHPPRTISVSAERCRTNRVRGKGRDPEVSFSLLDTADACCQLARDSRRRICALNFANGEHVGGGYKNGATAQEEDLCRRIPSLYTTLNNAKRDGLYPFGPCTCSNPRSPAKYSEVLYTKGLVIARASEADGFALLGSGAQVTVSLVTAAAPNVNFAKEVYDLDLMYETVKSIFIAPVLEEPAINTLVLGAWGCGAFGGDPVQISDLFTRAITDGLGRLYSEVHFAIPEGRNADVFKGTLERTGIKVSELETTAKSGMNQGRMNNVVK